MIKRSFVILCCLLLIFSVTIFSCKKESKSQSAQKVELKVGMTLTMDSHYGMGLQELARLIKLYSNETVTLEIFPNSTLGNERDLIEGVSMGTIPMALSSTGPIPNFFPEFAVLDLPYLFPTAEIAYKALDGEVGTELLGLLDSKGIIGLGFWENGFRHVTNSKKEIKKPADLKGMKIRTMENEIHMNAYRQYGATPTPMAFGELFIAMQQGAVDGQENPAILINTSKFFEVQKYMSLTGNFYSPSVLMISKKVFDGMTEAQKNAVLKAAGEAKEWQRNFSQSNTAAAIDNIRKSGTTVTEVNLDEWIAVSQATYKDFAGKLNQDHIKKIQAIK